MPGNEVVKQPSNQHQFESGDAGGSSSDETHQVEDQARRQFVQWFLDIFSSPNRQKPEGNVSVEKIDNAPISRRFFLRVLALFTGSAAAGLLGKEVARKELDLPRLVRQLDQPNVPQDIINEMAAYIEHETYLSPQERLLLIIEMVIAQPESLYQVADKLWRRHMIEISNGIAKDVKHISAFLHQIQELLYIPGRGVSSRAAVAFSFNNDELDFRSDRTVDWWHDKPPKTVISESSAVDKAEYLIKSEVKIKSFGVESGSTMNWNDPSIIDKEAIVDIIAGVYGRSGYPIDDLHQVVLINSPTHILLDRSVSCWTDTTIGKDHLFVRSFVELDFGSTIISFSISYGNAGEIIFTSTKERNNFDPASPNTSKASLTDINLAFTKEDINAIIDLILDSQSRNSAVSTNL